MRSIRPGIALPAPVRVRPPRLCPTSTTGLAAVYARRPFGGRPRGRIRPGSFGREEMLRTALRDTTARSAEPPMPFVLGTAVPLDDGGAVLHRAVGYGQALMAVPGFDGEEAIVLLGELPLLVVPEPAL